MQYSYGGGGNIQSKKRKENKRGIMATEQDHGSAVAAVTK